MFFLLVFPKKLVSFIDINFVWINLLVKVILVFSKFIFDSFQKLVLNKVNL